MKQPIRLLLADDHEVYRDGLKSMLSRTPDIVLVGEADNGRELIALANDLQPDVILTDIKMPLIDGIAATREIAASHPAMGIIGLSMYDEDRLIAEMMEAGAMGYLIKNAGKAEITEAIQTVHSGKHYYCPTTSNKLMMLLSKQRERERQKAVMPTFTEKELEIVRLVYGQKTAKEIADSVFLSHRTIEGLKLKIMEKMGVNNNVGIVVYALKNGLIAID